MCLLLSMVFLFISIIHKLENAYLPVFLGTMLALSVMASGGILLNHGGSGVQKAYATFPGINGKIAFTSERDGNREIYAMNPDGSSQTRLTSTPSSTDQEPDW